MCQHCIGRYLQYLKDEISSSARIQGSIPLGKKKLGFCGRMPGDSEDQIDFTKEANTIGRNRIAKKNTFMYIFKNGHIISGQPIFTLIFRNSGG